MTKSEEIAEFRRWVATLPKGSYLEIMFGGKVGQIENEIRNDFAGVTVANVLAEREEARDDLDLLRRQANEIKSQIETLQAARDRLTMEVASVKKDMAKLAGRLADLSS